MEKAMSADLRQARLMLSDLFRPNPVIYWADLLLSLTVGYGCATIYLIAPFSPVHLLFLPLAGFGLYRASLFMHEIVHFKQGEMTGFATFWNLVAGVPMLIPSFLYESHISHHNTHDYGTDKDGEYLPLGTGGMWGIVKFLAQILMLPVFVFLRFAIISPISFLHPKLRQWVLEHASSFVIDFSYRRPLPANAPRARWAAYDLLTWIRCVAMISCLLLAVVPWTRLIGMYFIALFTLGTNHLRTLVAHRYLSDGNEMSHLDQMTDSVNIVSRSWLTELVFPLGLRYHALHHLYPSLPYHNLGIAHRRLVERLPADSPYHRINCPGYFAAAGELLRNVLRSRAAAGSSPDRQHAA